MNENKTNISCEVRVYVRTMDILITKRLPQKKFLQIYCNWRKNE